MLQLYYVMTLGKTWRGFSFKLSRITCALKALTFSFRASFHTCIDTCRIQVVMEWIIKPLKRNFHVDWADDLKGCLSLKIK